MTNARHRRSRPWWVNLFIALGALSFAGILAMIPLLVSRGLKGKEGGRDAAASASSGTLAARPDGTPETSATASAPASPAQLPESATAAASPVGTLAPVPSATPTAEAAAPPRQIQSQSELDSFRDQVNARIDAAGGEHSEEMKETAREVLRRLTGIIKVTTLQFSSGEEGLSESNRTALVLALRQPEISAFLERYERARFIMLGFADPVGSPEINARLSRERAKAVGTAVKDECPDHRSYSFGLGSTQILDAKNRDKNRAVEVWLAVDTQ